MLENIAGTFLYKLRYPYHQTALLLEVSFRGESPAKLDTVNCIFFYEDGRPVKVKVAELIMDGVYQEEGECRSNFGEIESFVSIPGGYEIAGDFGCIEVYCDAVSPGIDAS